MAKILKQKHRLLAGCIAGLTLLSACGSDSGSDSGTNTNSVLGPAPAQLANVGCNANVDDIQNSTLHLINTARATARACGDTFFEAAAPLTWNSKLATAARLHSNDMATNNFFSHTGSDGLSVAQRVDAQQYNWSDVGENIAAGQSTTESAVNGWLESPGHCKNLMNPAFREMAVTCVENDGSQFRQYWTNVLGTGF